MPPLVAFASGVEVGRRAAPRARPSPPPAGVEKEDESCAEGRATASCCIGAFVGLGATRKGAAADGVAKAEAALPQP